MIDRVKGIFNPLLGDELDEDYKKCLPVYDFDPIQKYLHEIKVNKFVFAVLKINQLFVFIVVKINTIK